MANGKLPRYAIWNNKGGVGKTFLTFMMASEYAEKYPERNVVVLDMCPQANVSEILLGGNGTGSRNLDALLKKTPRQSVGGYFDQRITSPHLRTGTELSFLVSLKDYNTNLRSNMFLVAGDPSLELQAQAINQISAQTLPADSWANVHKWVLDLVSAISTQLPNSVFFIDCNPSFSAYTELALLAADRLVIPCTADGSSARAIDNVGQLLYGFKVPASYSSVNFASKARTNSMALPSIHLVPLNRSTQYDKRASKAFNAMYNEIQRRVEELRLSLSGYFSLALPHSPFLDIPDAHAVSVVASHKGLPLSGIKTTKYQIHDKETQVNPEPLQRYKTASDNLVGLL